jgi:hypothetical protein
MCDDIEKVILFAVNNLAASYKKCIKNQQLRPTLPINLVVKKSFNYEYKQGKNTFFMRFQIKNNFL